VKTSFDSDPRLIAVESKLLCQVIAKIYAEKMIWRICIDFIIFIALPYDQFQFGISTFSTLVTVLCEIGHAKVKPLIY
jgi:hypothetical protein